MIEGCSLRAGREINWSRLEQEGERELQEKNKRVWWVVSKMIFNDLRLLVGMPL